MAWMAPSNLNYHHPFAWGGDGPRYFVNCADCGDAATVRLFLNNPPDLSPEGERIVSQAFRSAIYSAIRAKYSQPEVKRYIETLQVFFEMRPAIPIEGPKKKDELVN